MTDAYADKGVVFASPAGNAAPFIASDASNPTSPVLSGSPLFSGDIILTFVLPGTAVHTRVNKVSLDVGFIDNPRQCPGARVLPARD